jgi:hypothetical protein
MHGLLAPKQLLQGSTFYSPLPHQRQFGFAGLALQSKNMFPRNIDSNNAS